MSSRFGRLPEELMRRKDVSPATKVIYNGLAFHRNERTGQCNPSQAALAATTGLGLRTVRDALHELERNGLIYCRVSEGRQTEYYLPHLTKTSSEQRPDSAFYQADFTPQTPAEFAGDTPADSAGHPGENCRTPRQNLPTSPTPPNKDEQTKEQTRGVAHAYTREGGVGQGQGEVTDSRWAPPGDDELVDRADDWDEEGVFAHYMAEQARYRRRGNHAAQVRDLLRRLACDGRIDPQLSNDQLKAIVSQWLGSGFPMRAAHLWRRNPRHGVPEWEVSLLYHERQKTTNRGRHDDEKFTNPDGTEKSYDEIRKALGWEESPWQQPKQ